MRKVFDHDRHLVLDGVTGQLDQVLEHALRLGPVVLRVIGHRLDQAPVGLVGGIVPQHVENESLFDRLAHRVEAEGPRLAVLVLCPKELQRLGLGRRRKGKGADVGQVAAQGHLLNEDVLHILEFASLGGLGLVQAVHAQRAVQGLGGCAGLGRMGLVDDHCKPLAGQVAHFAGDDGEFLQGGDNDPLARFQGFPELLRVLVDGLYHAPDALKVPHGLLELAIEHAPVRDDDHAVKHRLILVVV